MAAMDCAEVHGLGRTAQKHGREELPLTQVQGWQWRGATPWPRSGAAAESARLRWRRSSQEEQPHFQTAVVAWAQEGLEKLLHVQG